MVSRRQRVLAAVCLLGALAGLPARAAVVTDGSVGRAVTIAGPAHAVPATLGQVRGGNLFHSFLELNLAKGESVSFSGPEAVRNVLARVTGGVASSIDGTIRSEIPGAHFYLMNPAGVA